MQEKEKPKFKLPTNIVTSHSVGAKLGPRVPKVVWHWVQPCSGKSFSGSNTKLYSVVPFPRKRLMSWRGEPCSIGNCWYSIQSRPGLCQDPDYKYNYNQYLFNFNLHSKNLSADSQDTYQWRSYSLPQTDLEISKSFYVSTAWKSRSLKKFGWWTWWKRRILNRPIYTLKRQTHFICSN